MSSTILDINPEEFNRLSRIDKIILLQEKVDLLMREEEEEVKKMRASLDALINRNRWGKPGGGTGGANGDAAAAA